MLLRSLTLHNIGVYKGAQTIEFSTLPDQPITLIGGNNGAGKTSLLDAIPLALYGSRARRILGARSYPDYLNDLVHYGMTEASVRLEFDRAQEGRWVRYDVERTWRRVEKGKPSDSLRVIVDGAVRTDLEAAWPEFVDRIMPMAVSELTIFDGEKIKALADPDSSRDVLRTSLYGLLGLDLIQRLESDLGEYRRRVAKTVTSDVSADLQARLAEAEVRLSAALTDLDQAEADHTRTEEQLADATERTETAKAALSKSGGGLFARREELHDAAANARQARSLATEDLHRLAGTDLPVLMLPNLLKAIVVAGTQSTERDRHDALYSYLGARDSRVLAALEAGGASTEALEKLREVLEADLDAMDQPGEPPFSVTDAAMAHAADLLGDLGDELAQQAGQTLDRYTTADASLLETQRALDAVPDAGRIAIVVEDVAAGEREVTLLGDVFARSQSAVNEKRRRVEAAKSEVDRLAVEVLEADAGSKNHERILREIRKAELTLGRFSARIVEKNVAMISQEITSALTSLLRKHNLVSRVEIHPTTLMLTPIGPDGSAVDPGRLSAGERQMLATAVLWGLSRCTGKTLPTVIDTPVGRLDTSHRTNLVRRYFPFAARQVVLLSTDEEITGDYLADLTPKIGRRYLLDYDDDTGTSAICAGYFE